MLKHISLTGGPCAGKTTALAYLYDNLVTRGWRVVIVPEAATIVLNASGRLLEERTPAFMAKAQKTILTLQKTMPEILSETLQEEEKVVFLYDRAELDNRAYVNDEIFSQILKETHDKTPWEVAQKYDGIVHLVTAADGAEKAYTLANNEARRETAEEARILDEKTRQAWLGHSHYTIIANRGTFDEKLVQTLKAVLNILGEPEPLECERKWKLVRDPDISAVKAVPVHIKQYYLQPAQNSEQEVRLRARTIDDVCTFYKTIKIPTGEMGVRKEYETIISEETFNELLAYRNDSAVIEKTRYCFSYQNQHFELDCIERPVKMWLLEAELLAKDQPLTLPPFLGLMEEVTHDASYSNAFLARNASLSA